jgi:hypothetical protein
MKINGFAIKQTYCGERKREEEHTNKQRNTKKKRKNPVSKGKTYMNTFPTKVSCHKKD